MKTTGKTLLAVFPLAFSLKKQFTFSGAFDDRGIPLSAESGKGFAP